MKRGTTAGVSTALMTIVGIGCLYWNKAEQRSPTAAAPRHSAVTSGAHSGIAASPGKSRFVGQFISVGAKAFVVKSTLPSFASDGLKYVEDRLEASRRGDGLASYEIYLRVRACRHALSAESDLTFPAYASLGEGGEYLKERKQQILLCEGLALKDETMGRDWLSLAAAQGSLEARLMYATVPEDVLGGAEQMLKDPAAVINYKRTALRYLEESAASGSVDALGTLGAIYKNGITAPYEPVLAAAYFAAAKRAKGNGNAQEALADDGLPIEQQKAALELSEKIYRGCCR